MSDRFESASDMFISLKAMFPHIDLSIINENLTFSQNLQNLVAQLGTPHQRQTRSQISNMKEVVDRQQLKIQKSLVNEEDVLGNITNRTMRRQRLEKQQKGGLIIEAIQQQSSEQYWQNEENQFPGSDKNLGYALQDIVNDVISDIWELDPEPNKDWFRN